MEERGLRELSWLSRGEVGIDHENFPRKLKGKKRKRPRNRICKYVETGDFSEQISSLDITQIWLGWHSLLGTWARVLLFASASSGLGPRPSSQSSARRWPLRASATGLGSKCLVRVLGGGGCYLGLPLLIQPLQAPFSPGLGLGQLGCAPRFPGPSLIWLLWLCSCW